MIRGSTRTVLPSFGRFSLPRHNDPTAIYFVVGAWTAALTIVVGVASAVVFDVPGLWFIAVLPIPSLIDKLYRIVKGARAVNFPLLLDATTIGVGVGVSGLAPIVVVYSLLMLTVVSFVATSESHRVLFPYVAFWMGLGIYFSEFSEPILSIDPVVGRVLVAIHVPLAAAGTITILTQVMQRLRESEARRSRVVGGLVHDMKNALTGALGMAELLSDNLADLEPSEIKEYAGLVLDEGRSVVAMTDDLLTMERADAGQLEISTQHVDLQREIRAVLLLSGHDADIAIEVSEPSGHPLALGDPARVRQIVRNLVSNASRHGGEVVRISIGTTGPNVFIRVSDSGVAIPESERDRIFKPYQSARNVPRHGDSIGLGLSMSREVARLMGGDLSYEHIPGWSVFELTLPAAYSAVKDDVFGEVQVTRAEQIWLGTDGILHSIVHPGCSLTVDDARAGVEAYMRVGGGVRRPTLINLENLANASMGARSHYVNSPVLAQCVNAVALVVQDASIARFLADHVVKFLKPPFPARLFEDETTALAWLGQYLPSNQSP